jgi:DNA-binding response OmpR family regulator
MARRILIVDDEAAIRFAVSEYFIAYAYCVDSAEDLVSARRLLSRNVYDAVIADLRLGGSQELDGLAVIDIASRLPQRPCIVLLSADHSPQLVQDAKRRGANFALHKPLPLYELKACIGQYLAWLDACKADAEFKPGQFAPTLPGGT